MQTTQNETIIQNLTDYLIELNDFDGYTNDEMIAYIDHCIDEFKYDIALFIDRLAILNAVYVNVKHLVTE